MKKKKRNKKWLVGLRIQIDIEKPTSAPTEAAAVRKAKQAVIKKGVKLNTKHFDRQCDNAMERY